MTHKHVSELGRHWFRPWLAACSVSTYYPNQRLCVALSIRTTYQVFLVVKSETSNLFHGQGTKQAYNQCNIENNYKMKNKLAQNLYDKHVLHVNTTKPTTVIQFFEIIFVAFWSKFY